MSRRVTNVASGGWGVALFVLLITLPYTNAHSMSCSEDKIDQIIYKLGKPKNKHHLYILAKLGSLNLRIPTKLQWAVA